MATEYLTTSFPVAVVDASGWAGRRPVTVKRATPREADELKERAEDAAAEERRKGRIGAKAGIVDVNVVCIRD